MSNLYPISRESRQTEVLVASAAQTVFGPTAYKVWDIEDIKVAVKPVGGEWGFVTDGLTIAKISSDVLEKVTLTFDVGRGAGDLVQITSARVHERLGSVTQGGTINSQNIEREFSRLATVIQELRRDIDNTPAFLPGDGGLSFKNNQLKNILAGVAENDAVNVAQVVALAAFGFVHVGPWGNNPVFAKNALTTNVDTLYICTVPHTRTADTEPGVGVDWETVFDIFPVAIAGGDFQSSGLVAMFGNLNFGGNSAVNVDLVDGRNVSDDGARLDSFSVNLSSFSLPDSAVITAFGKSVVGLADVAGLLALLGLSNDPWLFEPIGKPFPLLLHIPGVELPPTDQSYRYVLLSAGESGPGGYNEGVIINEVNTGASPTKLATGVIDWPTSTMHGQVIGLANTEKRYFRPGEVSGVLQESQNLAHTHSYTGTTSANKGTAILGGLQQAARTTGSEGGDEARPREEQVPYMVRIF